MLERIKLKKRWLVMTRNKLEVISEEEGKKYLKKCKPAKVLIEKKKEDDPKAANKKEEK